MFISRRCITGLLALTMAAGMCLGEEPKEPAKYYKLEFMVKEVAGAKTLNSRTYTTMVSTENPKTEIRAGSKIPWAVAVGNFQQIDVGVNLDVLRVKEVQDRLAFGINAEISSVAEVTGDQTRPTIRQNRWSCDVIVPLRKATLLFSSESVDSKTQFQVEVMATPVP